MKRAIITVVLTLLLSLPPTATPEPSFGDGDDEMVLDLASPGFSATAKLLFPSGFYLASANMSIAGMASETNASAYPGNVTVHLNDTLLWAFRETGFGPLGRQDLFSSGEATARLAFDRGGGSENVSIRLPRNASVTAAGLDLDCVAPPDRHDLLKVGGVNSGDSFGASVSGAGDINNDGYDDLIVGARRYDFGAEDTGGAYIYLGGSGIDDLPDAILTGPSAHDYFGCSVAGVGDVNGDGSDDFLVGAYGTYVGINHTGVAYLYFGKQKMNATPDITFYGIDRPDQFGWSVSGAGDVNRDGYVDLIIGANRAHPVNDAVGAAYIFFGGPAMDNVADVIMSGTGEFDEFGYCVSYAGDVNGDGYADVMVGAPYNDAGSNNAGRAYIFFGGPAMDNVADVVITGVAADDNLGYAVSGAGDVNGDGFDDVIVGAPFNNGGGADAGRAYLLLGGPSMDDAPDLVMTGESPGDQFGSSVSDTGDMNRDGFGDIVIARNSEGNESAYVFFGNSSMDNLPDFVFTGGGASPQRVSHAGDVNSDGYDDIIVGDQANQATRLPGRAFVYTTHLENPGGILDPSVSVASKTVWDRSGIVNGTYKTGDFAAVLNDYLRSATCSTTDAFGNSYVDVPLRISAGNDGSLVLTNLSVVYRYNATALDFSAPLNRYLADHQGDADLSGNITVPVEIGSESPGRVRLSGLVLRRDVAPSLAGPIDTVDFYEDSINVKLVDLHAYFRDDVDSLEVLTFSLVDSTNSTVVRTWIWSNRYVAVDSITGDLNDNWTGTVEATVACSDRWGQKNESNRFMIRINNVNDPPAIAGGPLPAAEPGIEYRYDITAADGDGDPLGYALVRAPGGMTLDSKTGNLRWVPHASGSFNLTVSVSDGLATAQQNFTLAVPNRPPRITSTPPLNASTGDRYVYEVAAADDNLDPLSYNISAGGDGISVDTTGSVLDFTPTRTGNVSVTVRVSDGTFRTYQNFTIRVLQGNRPPGFRSAPVTTAYVKWLYVYNASASDPESDQITYSIENGPPGMTVDASSGKVTWTPESTGNFSCVLKADDGRNGQARQQFVIHVLEAVRPSVRLARPYSGEVLKGKAIFSGQVTRGTRDVLLVQMRIDGKEWNNATGTYGWNLTLDTRSLRNGMHTFDLRAFDGVEYSDLVSERFKVDNPAGDQRFWPMAYMLVLLAITICISALALWKRKRPS